MRWLFSAVRSLGPAGAVANARAELSSAHDITVKAAIAVNHVNGHRATLRVVASDVRSEPLPTAPTRSTEVPLPRSAGTRVA